MSAPFAKLAIPGASGADADRFADRFAARLALAGAMLGAAVGVIELAVGASIRDWVGGKQDTTALGFTTLGLSMLALGAARIVLRSPVRDPASGGRVGVALALILPALICLTTAGRLWYLPGTMLLGAGALLLTRTSRSEWAAALTEWHWRAALLALCGTYYAFLGAATLDAAGLLGVAGGLAMWSAAYVALRHPRLAYGLLGVGAIPFAVATWWSGVTPVIALLSIACGSGAIRYAGHDPHQATEH